MESEECRRWEMQDCRKLSSSRLDVWGGNNKGSEEEEWWSSENVEGRRCGSRNAADCREQCDVARSRSRAVRR